MISTHDAFGYFAAAYGIEFISAPGRFDRIRGQRTATSPASSPRSRRARIPAVFLENISDPRLIQPDIGRDRREGQAERSIPDSLTDEKGDAPTYIDMVRHNIKALTSALGN